MCSLFKPLNYVLQIFKANLFKYTIRSSFNDLRLLIVNEVTPVINKKITEKNLTKSEISSTCQNKENEELKHKMEAMILSYMYLFLDKKAYKIGAGDLAASKFQTGLSERDALYTSTHTLLSKIFNKMVNGSIPGSIFETPNFFTIPSEYEKKIMESDIRSYYIIYSKMLRLFNVSDGSMRFYQFLWFSYLSNTIEVAIYCIHALRDCTDTNQYSLGKSS